MKPMNTHPNHPSAFSIYWRDIQRSIRQSKRRFFALLMMTLLGALIFIGLISTGPNMEQAMERPIEQSHREHITISSYFGIDPTDQAKIEALDGLEEVEYYYQSDYYMNESDKILTLRSLPTRIATPFLTEGSLPTRSNEILMDADAKQEGYQIGDSITLWTEADREETDTPAEETKTLSLATKDSQESSVKSDETPTIQTESIEIASPLPDVSLSERTFVITGFAESIHYMEKSSKGTTQLGDGSVQYFAYALANVFQKTNPDGALLRFSDLALLPTYTSAYQSLEQEKVDRLETLFQNRPDEIKASLQHDLSDDLQEAQQKVDEGYQTLEDTSSELRDAESKLSDGKAAYENGVAEYESQMAEAEAQLDEAREELRRGEAELQEAQATYDQGAEEYEKARVALNENADQLNEALEKIQSGQEELARARQSLESQGITRSALEEQQKKWLAQLEDGGARLNEAEQAELAANLAQVEQGIAQWDALERKEAELAAADAAHSEALARYQQALQEWKEKGEELEAASDELSAGWSELEAGRSDLAEGQSALDEGRAEGKKELDDASSEILAGEREYQEGWQKFQEERPEALESLSDAQNKITDSQKSLRELKVPAYRMAGRYSDTAIEAYLDGADNMKALTFLFPTVFYLIAMLITMTTTTRMVEEERSSIGTLKALGYGNAFIMAKYLFIATLPAGIGTILGILLGYYFLMPVIFDAYSFGVRTFGIFDFHLNPLYPALALFIGVGLSLLTAFFSSRYTLSKRAADLLRPKPPQRGNRIFLEHFTFLWKRLDFMTKITFRNLTAKKSRMILTILGVSGCTALMVMGFGLRDSIVNMVDKQLGTLQNYDVQILYNSDAETKDLYALEQFVKSVSTQYAQFYASSGSFKDKEALEKTTSLLVPFEENAFRSMRPIQDRKSGKSLPLTDDGVIATEKLTMLLPKSADGLYEVQDEWGKTHRLPITDIAESYVGHTLFLSPNAYEKYFGEEAKPNSYYLALSQPEDWDNLKKAIENNPAVQAEVRSTDTREELQTFLDSINIIVVVIILISSTLAFIVLFNLTNLNVAERQRELSTIKVLGFTDREVTQYIYRETLLLTSVGIVIGLLAGKLLHLMICLVLSASLILIDPYLEPRGYFVAILLTILFSLVVMAMIHSQLKRVNMVEALKEED